MGQHKQKQRKKTRHETQLCWNAGNWEEKVHPTTERAWSLPAKDQLLQEIKKQRTQQVLVAVKVYGSRKVSWRRIQRQEGENKK